MNLAQVMEGNWFGKPLTKETRSRAFVDYLGLLYTPEEVSVAMHLKTLFDVTPSKFDPDVMITLRQVARLFAQVEFFKKKR